MAGRPSAVQAHRSSEVECRLRKDIEPHKRRALVTVAPVPTTLYRTIIDDGSDPKPDDSLPPPAVDPKLEEIAQALMRKGQVILWSARHRKSLCCTALCRLVATA